LGLALRSEGSGLVLRRKWDMTYSHIHIWMWMCDTSGYLQFRSWQLGFSGSGLVLRRKWDMTYSHIHIRMWMCVTSGYLQFRSWQLGFSGSVWGFRVMTPSEMMWTCKWLELNPKPQTLTLNPKPRSLHPKPYTRTFGCERVNNLN